MVANEETNLYRAALERVGKLLIDGWKWPLDLEEAERVVANALARGDELRQKGEG